MGFCLLKHWFVDLAGRGVKLRLLNLQEDTKSLIQRMGLLNGIDAVTFDGHVSNNVQCNLHGQLTELKSLCESNEINHRAQEIAKTIVHGIHDFDYTPDPDQMHVSDGERAELLLGYVFSEILENTFNHGRRGGYKDACANIAALYYPELKKLEIAILDNGCGLLETLRSHPEMRDDISDRRAIEIALLPRISCNRDIELERESRNEGIGLTVSTKIALQARGRCGIFSGKSRRDLFLDVVSEIEIPYWQGTGVFFQFNKTTELLGVSIQTIIEALPTFKRIERLRFE